MKKDRPYAQHDPSYKQIKVKNSETDVITVLLS